MAALANEYIFGFCCTLGERLRKAGIYMKEIESSLNGRTDIFADVRDILAPEGFTLANWDYDGGYFDCQLDEKAMVYLRLPVEVRQGQLDYPDAVIQFGTPFVLKHVYQTGIDPDIGYATGPQVAAMVNQFQEPAEKDAPVEPHYVEKGKQLLRKVENIMEQRDQ